MRMRQKKGKHTCGTCSKVFTTAVGLAADASKAHDQHHVAYAFERGTACQVWLKEYHSSSRLKAHLRRTSSCLTRLVEAEIAFPELSGDRFVNATALKPVTTCWTTTRPHNLMDRLVTESSIWGFLRGIVDPGLVSPSHY